MNNNDVYYTSNVCQSINGEQMFFASCFSFVYSVNADLILIEIK